MKRDDLTMVVLEALKYHKGSATILEVCKFTWSNYESELRKSVDLFYTWQYDIRWAGTVLRKEGKMKSKEISPRGLWELV